MLSMRSKEEIFEHIKRGVESQKDVRKCKAEGMVRDVEKDLEQFNSWGLITHDQWNDLLDLLYDIRR